MTIPCNDATSLSGAVRQLRLRSGGYQFLLFIATVSQCPDTSTTNTCSVDDNLATDICVSQAVGPGLSWLYRASKRDLQSSPWPSYCLAQPVVAITEDNTLRVESPAL